MSAQQEIPLGPRDIPQTEGERAAAARAELLEREPGHVGFVDVMAPAPEGHQPKPLGFDDGAYGRARRGGFGGGLG